MQFTIPGSPTGKGRPRATTINGMARMYTPAKTTSYEGMVVMFYANAGGKKLDGPISVRIEATFEMPLSWSAKKRKTFDGKWCMKKPDGDNIAKIICDALNGVAYHDDSSVVLISVMKRWGQDGSVAVVIDELSEMEVEQIEMTAATADDIEGDPIGWEIVSIGHDGSVLCKKPNGQRVRYLFYGDS